MALNPRQQRFVAEYLINPNATQAAIKAGYRPKAAGATGHENLKKPEIAAALAKAHAKQAAKMEITADRVLSELALIGFANMQDYMRANEKGDPYLDFGKLTREQAAALSEVTVEDFTAGRGEDAREVRRVKFKLADKRAALVDIGRHLGMFKDKSDDRPPVPILIDLRSIVHQEVDMLFSSPKAPIAHDQPAVEGEFEVKDAAE